MVCGGLGRGKHDPSDTWSFTTQAEIVNQAPDLAGIGNQAVDELVGLNFVATATDDGLPSDTLTFSLEASGTGSVPSGATIGLLRAPSTGHPQKRRALAATASMSV